VRRSLTIDGWIEHISKDHLHSSFPQERSNLLWSNITNVKRISERHVSSFSSVPIPHIRTEEIQLPIDACPR
jgi:hypothetical protein